MKIIINEPNLKINKVIRMAQAFINLKVKKLGLTSGLFYFILELVETDGLSMQELSKAVYVDNACTTRAVNKLVELGYAAKEVNSNDCRSFNVSLTEKGQAIAVSVKDVLVELANLLTANVSEEEIKTVYRVFDKYYSNVWEYLNANKNEE